MPMRWRWPPENSCGIAVARARRQADQLQHARRPRPASRRSRAAPWISSGSMTMSSTVMRGLSAPIRVLENDLHGAGASRSASRPRRVMSSPSNTIWPAVGSISRISSRPSVDLPQPDSPTRPSVSPAAISKSTTSSTARSAYRRCGAKKPPGADREMLGEADGLEQRRHRRGELRDADAGGGRGRRRTSTAAASARRRPRLHGAQRGAKRQPRGAPRRLGQRARDRHQPLAILRPATARNPAGRACRDAAAGRTAASTGACSTIRPAYITSTRSAVSATTPMLWVMIMIAMPNSSRRSISRSRICAWMVTSSAVVGSSAISSCGRQASAMAIITRWRCRRRAGADSRAMRRAAEGMPTFSSISTARATLRFCGQRAHARAASP